MQLCKGVVRILSTVVQEMVVVIRAVLLRSGYTKSQNYIEKTSSYTTVKESRFEKPIAHSTRL